jgi:hypothetical protein
VSWDAKNVALLTKLWALGQSTAQIARRIDQHGYFLLGAIPGDGKKSLRR